MVVRQLIEIDEAEIKRVARIVGESSAAAQALKDAERRRAAGERVGFYRDVRDPRTILVGPKPETSN